MERLFMNPNTGSVAPLEEWIGDYETAKREGDVEEGVTFEEWGELIEVEPDGDGWYKKV